MCALCCVLSCFITLNVKIHLNFKTELTWEPRDLLLAGKKNFWVIYPHSGEALIDTQRNHCTEIERFFAHSFEFAFDICLFIVRYSVNPFHLFLSFFFKFSCLIKKLKIETYNWTNKINEQMDVLIFGRYYIDIEFSFWLRSNDTCNNMLNAVSKLIQIYLNAK